MGTDYRARWRGRNRIWRRADLIRRLEWVASALVENWPGRLLRNSIAIRRGRSAYRLRPDVIDRWRHRRDPVEHFQLISLSFDPRVVSVDTHDPGDEEQNCVGRCGRDHESAPAFKFLPVRLGFNQVGKHLFGSSSLPVPSGQRSWRVRQRNGGVVPAVPRRIIFHSSFDIFHLASAQRSSGLQDRWRMENDKWKMHLCVSAFGHFRPIPLR